MSVSRRPTVYVLGVLVTGLVGVVGALPAESRAPTPNELRADCAARVNELEAEVRALREQLHVATAQKGNSSSTLARSRLPSRGDFDAQAVVAGHYYSLTTPSDLCNPPYRFDRHGIKYYRPECLVPAESSSCSIPYGFTPSGIKYYKPNCLDAKPSLASCDPPFVFESTGVKRYKPECL